MRVFLAVLLLSACVKAPPTPAAISGFRLEVEPADSELTIDGDVYGPVSSVQLTDGVLRLDPGIHQVSLKRKGYQTWRGEVALGNTIEALKVSLVKR